MILSRAFLLPLLTLTLSATLAPAQGKDTTGSKDSPLVSRYPGSAIDRYAQHEFDEFAFPVGAPANGAPKSQTLEGKGAWIVYKNLAGRPGAEIDRNCESALTGSGFTPIFVCKADACGIARLPLTADWPDVWKGTGPFQFSGKATRPDGGLNESQHVSTDETRLHLTQGKAMEGGQVVEAATLAEIAKHLQQDPKLKLCVVGHRDNVGALAANVDLARRRAAAVVQALNRRVDLVRQ